MSDTSNCVAFVYLYLVLVVLSLQTGAAVTLNHLFARSRDRCVSQITRPIEDEYRMSLYECATSCGQRSLCHSFQFGPLGHCKWMDAIENISITTGCETPSNLYTDGWIAGSASHYRIVKSQMKWDEAQLLCEMLGANLLKVDTLEEFAEVQGLLTDPDQQYWTGACQPRETAKWYEWRDGSSVLTTPEWKEGAWDNHEPNFGSGLQAVVIKLNSYSGIFRWNDQSVDRPVYAICEINN